MNTKNKKQIMGISKGLVKLLEVKGIAVEQQFIEENIPTLARIDVTLSWNSPAGQDINLNVQVDVMPTMNQDAIDTAFSIALDKVYNDYDVSQEAYYWLGEDGHGKNGAPDDMRDVYDDFQTVAKKLGHLSLLINAFIRMDDVDEVKEDE